MSNATAVGTPQTLSDRGTTGIRKIAYDKQLREDVVRSSVFTQIPTALKVSGNEVIIEKAGVFMSIPSGEGGTSQSRIMTMRLPLKKPPVYGATELIGQEEDCELRYATFYYNEIRKAMKAWQYGYNFNDTAYLNLNAGNEKSMKIFHSELFDLRCHQTVLQKIADELAASPVSLSRTINPNVIVPNLVDTSFPAWDKDASTITEGAADAQGWYSARAQSGATAFVENVAAAILAGSGTGTTTKCLPTIDTFQMIAEYSESELLCEKVMLDGIETTVLLVPPRVLAWAMNPRNSYGIGEHIEKSAAYAGALKRSILPGEVGRLFDHLLLVKDPRYCTITISGSAGSYSIAPGFLYPGNWDKRNKAAWANTSGSTNFSFDMILGLCANAIAEYLVDPMVTNLVESYDYNRIKGQGTYLGSGMQLPMWDKDAASQGDGSSKTLIYRGSFIVPIGRLPRVTVS